MAKDLNEVLSRVKIVVAINILNKYLESKDIKDELLFILSRIQRLEDDYYLYGMIDRHNANVEFNSIRKSFNDVTNKIPHDLNFIALIEREIQNIEKNIGRKRGLFSRSDDGYDYPLAKTTFASISDEQARLQQGNYNIVVVGKTGVGKSELVNYLFDKEKVTQTGIGKPVTQKGFHKINFNVNGIPTTLFDSWGLEINKTNEWLKELEKELRNRDIDKPASEWFHTILYCVAASSSRIEDFEIDIIKKFIQSKYRVVIVFTKSDLVEETDIKHLKKEIIKEINEPIVFTEVCSVEKNLRSGRTEKFGADELYLIINKGFWDSITLRLPDRCINLLIRIIDSWEEQQYYFIKNFTNNFNVDKVYPEIEKNSLELINSLESEQCKRVLAQEIENTINMYETFSRMLNLNTKIKDRFFEFTIKKIDDFDYKTGKISDMVLTILFLGLPLLVDAPKESNIELMEKKVKSFSTDLKKDILRLRPEIEGILMRMVNSLE